ncbi:MAG TPA: X-Pro aminopeptidase [Acetobacteraceae bacterium]|jgi:Xaa-Pro aminopeptidase|nr:X-Pro aminopeptidase [Acetobacteraceae bacterium]
MSASALSAVRQELVRQGLDGFIVPRADEHLGEYVPASAERLAWLTGFTGSAGMAVVLAETAAVFTDGRYVLQLAEQTDAAQWRQLHITEEPPPAWLAQNAQGSSGGTARIGYDPLLISEEALARYTDAGLDMVAAERNPIDAVWTDRPAPPAAAAIPHPLEYAGQTSEVKRADVARQLREAKQDAAVLTDPASIAWLLNIRGDDVPFTPFALAFAVVHASGETDLFIDPAKVPAETRVWLGNGVAVRDRAALLPALGALKEKTVRVDASGSPVWFAQQLLKAGAVVASGSDPCLLPKACKNEGEQKGARAAHLRDAAAVCRFLYWLSVEAPTGQQTEMSAAEALLGFRQQIDGFRGESFPAISGAGEHGAIIHYRVTDETNRPINPNEVYLIDSGAQYPDGTTDITRTVWTGPGDPPDSVRDRVTRVMQGHIALATAIFPKGVGGAHLDAMARRALWQVGLDYDHGTGHGVGSYLSVHEGPVSISRLARPVPIAAGMILSNEPGYYLPGHYGIRLENLLLVQPAALPDATKPFLCFETLTLAPFDRKLLNPALMTQPERDWLDGYHAMVLREVGPALGQAEWEWLAVACAPLG